MKMKLKNVVCFTHQINPSRRLRPSAQSLSPFTDQMGNDLVDSDVEILEMKQGKKSEKYEELENHEDSHSSSMLIFLQQIEKRENEVLSRETQQEEKELQWKRKLEEHEQEVKSLQWLVDKKCDDLEAKEKEHKRIETLIRDRERVFNHIQGCISEGTKKLDTLVKSIRRKSREAESKSKELDFVREKLKKLEDMTRWKESQLNAMQKSFEDCCKKLDECDQEIAVKNERLKSIQNSMVELSGELELKEKRLTYVRKLQEKNLELWRKGTEQLAHKFKMTERKLENLVGEMELKAEVLESNVEKFEYLMGKKIDDCLKGMELNEKNFLSLQRLVEEGFRELEEKESQYERRFNDFKLRQFEFESIQKSTLLVEKKVKFEQSEENDNLRNQMVKENQDFLLVLKKHNLICNEIFAALKASLDPAKLALQAMQGIYNLTSSAENQEFGESFLSRSCIVLLELLNKATPEINPRVRDEAMKLARDWKSRLTAATGNHFAVFSLLHFAASYRFGSTIDAKELPSFLDVIGLNKQALKLSLAICTVDKATDIAKSIRNLIQRGETIHAVAHICELKLTDKFPPASLLDDYLEHAENYTKMMLSKRNKYDFAAKRKAMDGEEAALRAVMECIKDCKLESESAIIILSRRIVERLGTLEKMGQSVGLELEQSKKRRNNNVAPQGQPVRIKVKFSGMTGSKNNSLGAD